MNRYYRLEGQFNSYKSRLSDIENEISDYKESNDIIEKANTFLLSFSESIRQKIKNRLEYIVNMALQAVFTDKQLQFNIIAKRTKTGLTYDLYIRNLDNDTIIPMYDSNGGGVFDIITMALRISFLRILRGQLRQVLVLDEPFKNLDKIRTQLAVKWLNLISEQMEIQFIIVTHIEELISLNDDKNKSFQFKLINGVTKIGNEDKQ